MEPTQESVKAPVRLVRLWETPIFLVKNPEHFAIKEGLVEYISSQETAQATAIESNVAVDAKHNLSESKFNFLEQDNEHVARLASFAMQASINVVSMVNQDAWRKFSAANMGSPELEIHESWYHVTKNGGAHGAHMHGNCSWCAIYYLDVGDWDEERIDNMVFSEFGEAIPKAKGGKNKFFRPFPTLYTDPGMAYFSQNVWAHNPEEGILLVFPSYLMHNAEPYTGTEKNRIVVSMNMKVILNKEDIDGEEE